VTSPEGGSSPPVIVVYGPTAGGKSDLALGLAERLGGVVINADALQVYDELRILTARPGPAAGARAPHRLYGVLRAAVAGSAAWWRAAALAEIAAAHAAGKRAILVGGTGLYINALIDGLSPVPPADEAARAKATALHAELGGEAFRAELARRDPEAAARLKSGDRQRLIRAWEVAEATGRPLSDWQKQPREKGHDLDFRLIGLLPPREELYNRIDRRFEAMVAAGALEEASAFDALGLSPSLPANKALGLPELRRHLKGEITLEEATRAAQQATRNYAKRQTTWFRHQLAEDREALVLHGCDAKTGELSESFFAEIMPFILRYG
jgi:tRNA dimethylallyltransferase